MISGTEFYHDTLVPTLFPSLEQGYPQLATYYPWVWIRYPFFPSGSGFPYNTAPWEVFISAPELMPSSSGRSPSPGETALSPMYTDSCGYIVMTQQGLYPDCVEAGCCPDPDPPDPPPGGCPSLYTWFGDRYKFINNILPQSELLTDLDNDALDYYPIFLTSTVDTFYYKFLITEEEKEVSRIDQFQLLAFDIPYQRGVLRFIGDGELGYLIDSLLPVSAITNEDQDVTDLLLFRDERRLEISGAGWVEVEYDLAGSRPSAGLGTDDSGGGVPVEPEPKDDPGGYKIAGDLITKTPATYTVSIMNETERWESVGTVYPRIRYEEQFIKLPTYVTRDKLRIRLAWERSVHLDALPYCSYRKQPTTPVKLALVKARHSGDGLVQNRLDLADSVRQALLPGDSIELTYYAEPPPDSLRRVFLFGARGKYRTLTDLELSQLTDSAVTDYEFDQNFPNPFNPVTTFRFGLPQAAHVTLEVYNILGQKVTTLTDREYPPGRHTVEWDSRLADGSEIASGVYFARLKAGQFTATKKMVVVK